MKPNLRPRPCRVAAGDPERALRKIRGVNFTRGTLLGDGDGDRTGAGTDIEDATRTAPAIYGFESGIHDALRVGARDQGVVVELQPQIAEIGVSEDALYGLATRTA